MIFNESKFPYADLFESSLSSQSNSSLTQHYFPPIPIIQPSNIPQPTSNNPQTNFESIQPSHTAQTDQSNVDLSTPGSHTPQPSTIVPTEQSQPSTTVPTDKSPTTPNRPPNIHPMQTRSKFDIHLPRVNPHSSVGSL